MFGFLRRAATEITDVKIRRTLYLSIVRSTLGYATQVWSPQLIDRLNYEDRTRPTSSYKVHFEVTIRVRRNVQSSIGKRGSTSGGAGGALSSAHDVITV